MTYPVRVSLLSSVRRVVCWMGLGLAGPFFFGLLGACSQRKAEPAVTREPPLASASAPASASVGAMPVAAPAASSAPFHCFSWIHGPGESSTDCFRSADACDERRKEMERGARPTAPCRPAEQASCTRTSRPPEPPDSGDERCFGHANQCERYRAFVARNKIVTTRCEGR